MINLLIGSITLDEWPILHGAWSRRAPLSLAVKSFASPLVLCVAIALAVDSSAAEVVAVVVTRHCWIVVRCDGDIKQSSSLLSWSSGDEGPRRPTRLV